MSTTSTTHFREALERTITDTVAPSALEVDRDGTFPTQNIRALGAAGVLGLLSSTDVGGGGLGLREAAEVIERLAGACGSTAMVGSPRHGYPGQWPRSPGRAQKLGDFGRPGRQLRVEQPRART